MKTLKKKFDLTKNLLIVSVVLNVVLVLMVGFLIFASIEPSAEKGMFIVEDNAVDIQHEVKSIGLDSDKLYSYCNGFLDRNKKDFCFREGAFSLDDSDLCEEIKSVSVADYCYITFIRQGRLHLCDNVQNEHVKSVCSTLSN